MIFFFLSLFYYECNTGYCDRQSGHCTCLSGRNGPLFEGAACERMTCPLGCNGHGTCTSNRQIAKTHGGRYDVKGHIPYVYDNWDAHKIYSCDCDTDYFGYDCSLRSCPRGDDPLTANQALKSNRLHVWGVGGLNLFVMHIHHS